MSKFVLAEPKILIFRSGGSLELTMSGHISQSGDGDFEKVYQEHGAIP